MKLLSPRSRRHAFTLVELLVVIAILATLASIMMPGIGKMKVKAKVTAAKNDMSQLQMAFTGYYTEYNRWPLRDSSDGPHKLEGSLLDVLTGSDDGGDAKQMNPRGMSFYETSKIAKSAKDHGYYAAQRRFNDPFGVPYEIYLDGDDDGEMTVPSGYEKFGTGRIKKKIMIISAGPDGKMSEVKDNITSWD